MHMCSHMWESGTTFGSQFSSFQCVGSRDQDGVGLVARAFSCQAISDNELLVNIRSKYMLHLGSSFFVYINQVVSLVFRTICSWTGLQIVAEREWVSFRQSKSSFLTAMGWHRVSWYKTVFPSLQKLEAMSHGTGNILGGLSTHLKNFY